MNDILQWIALVAVTFLIVASGAEHYNRHTNNRDRIRRLEQMTYGIEYPKEVDRND